ncbi:hypothetical protein KQX54_016689 [Cotesia glomerata]|uniref:Uncharacterized protein n=1 Tax=Cotesia glomerata TaxID=32391 RepID=A0AAV7I0J5_COTGL|nr:hypothetical protein KQX54_016689 [Cotesia glomerata]
MRHKRKEYKTPKYKTRSETLMRQKVELDPEQLTRRYYLRSQGIMGMKATYSHAAHRSFCSHEINLISVLCTANQRRATKSEREGETWRTGSRELKEKEEEESSEVKRSGGRMDERVKSRGLWIGIVD